MLLVLCFITTTTLVNPPPLFTRDELLEIHPETPIGVEVSSFEYELYLKILDEADPQQLPSIHFNYPYLTAEDYELIYSLAEELDIQLQEDIRRIHDQT